jgi:5-carboxymethyl-2-hydroxymuconate isomerase
MEGATMPHIIVEYTDNLEFDTQAMLAELQEALVSTGAVATKGIKSRAVRLADYRIADGSNEYAFVHVSLLIREGRPPEVQHAMVENSMEVLKNAFGGRFEEGYLSLSVDLKEMHRGTAMTLHNIPAGGIKESR